MYRAAPPGLKGTPGPSPCPFGADQPPSRTTPYLPVTRRDSSFPSSGAGLLGWARLRAPAAGAPAPGLSPHWLKRGMWIHMSPSLFVHPAPACESSPTAHDPAHGSAPMHQGSAAHRQAHEHLRLNCIECLTRYHLTYIVPTGTNAFVRRTAPSRPIDPRASRAPSPRRQYSNPQRLSRNLRLPRTGRQSTDSRSTPAASMMSPAVAQRRFCPGHSLDPAIGHLTVEPGSVISFLVDQASRPVSNWTVALTRDARVISSSSISDERGMTLTTYESIPPYPPFHPTVDDASKMLARCY